MEVSARQRAVRPPRGLVGGETPERLRASRRSRRRRSRRSRWRARSSSTRSGRRRCPRRAAGAPAAPGASLSATCRPVMRCGVARDVVLEARRVPDVDAVDHHADVVEPGLVEQLDGLADRREERRLVRLRDVRRLEPEAHPGGARRRGDLAHAVDARSRTPRLGIAIADRARQAEHRGRPVGGEPAHARAQRLDALGGIGRALHAGDARAAGSRGSPGCSSRRRGRSARAARSFASSSCGELELPDADAVEARGGVREHVLGERRVDGRDLAQRRASQRQPLSQLSEGGRHAVARRGGAAAPSSAPWRRGSPEPAPSPGPGCVDAPICQSPSIGVA